MVAPERLSYDRLRLQPIYVVLIALKVRVNRTRCGLSKVNNCSYLAWFTVMSALALRYVCQDLRPTTLLRNRVQSVR